MCPKIFIIAAFVLRGIRVESATKYRTIGSAVLMFALAASLAIVSAVGQEKNPDRNAYFGETHLHTSWPVDAWLFGNRITGPDDAYKFSNL